MRSLERARTVLPALIVALCVLLVACGDRGTVEISRESEPRGAASAVQDDPPERTGDFSEYCGRAAAARDSIQDLDQDPEAGLEDLAALAELAPEDLRNDFEVAIDRLGQLEGLDEDDPSSFSKVFEILFDPDLLAALAAIDQFTLSECGFVLDPDAGGSVDLDGDVDDELFGDDATSISLEDVEAVQDANDGASWAGKISGTFIGGGSDVQLSADPQRFSDDEALELCEAMIAGLSTKNPDVAVSVLNGSETVASSDSDGTCSLS